MRIMKCDRCGALDMENRFVTFRAEHDASWRLDLCVDCIVWLRKVLENRVEEKLND